MKARLSSILRRVAVLLGILSIAWICHYTGRKNFAAGYAVLAYAAGAVYFTIRLVQHGHLVRAIAAYFCSIVVMIAGYGWIYFHNGLIEGTTISYADSFYFSVVTWTTLGYGDLQPTTQGRLLAVSEAFVGYIYMGVFTALAYSVIGGARER